MRGCDRRGTVGSAGPLCSSARHRRPSNEPGTRTELYRRWNLTLCAVTVSAVERKATIFRSDLFCRYPAASLICAMWPMGWSWYASPGMHFCREEGILTCSRSSCRCSKWPTIKVNFLVPRMYFVKLHGTHFNYVLACISDMLMYSNTGFARYHICHELLHIVFSLLFFLFVVFLCIYVCVCIVLLPRVGE